MTKRQVKKLYTAYRKAEAESKRAYDIAGITGEGRSVGLADKMKKTSRAYTKWYVAAHPPGR